MLGVRTYCSTGAEVGSCAYPGLESKSAMLCVELIGITVLRVIVVVVGDDDASLIDASALEE